MPAAVRDGDPSRCPRTRTLQVRPEVLGSPVLILVDAGRGSSHAPKESDGCYADWSCRVGESAGFHGGLRDPREPRIAAGRCPRSGARAQHGRRVPAAALTGGLRLPRGRLSGRRSGRREQRGREGRRGSGRLVPTRSAHIVRCRERAGDSGRAQRPQSAREHERRLAPTRPRARQPVAPCAGGPAVPLAGRGVLAGLAAGVWSTTGTRRQGLGHGSLRRRHGDRRSTWVASSTV